jgi:NitT/TauT family transport system permease protein
MKFAVKKREKTTNPARRLKKREKTTYSSARRAFLKKESRKKFLIIASRISLLFFIVLVWEAAARTQLIDPFIFSSPSRLVKATGLLIENGTFLKHVWATTLETVIGFIIGTGLGCLIAIILWWSDMLRKILDPYIVILNSLPKIALGPIIIVWAGAGQGAIIAMTVLISVVITVITMLNGFLETDPDKILLLKTMNASKRQTLFKLILPSSMPAFISCLKINVGMAWVGAITGEYLVSQAGLGYLIVYGSQVFKLDLVMASIVLICILAAAMYYLVSFLERVFIKDARLSR